MTTPVGGLSNGPAPILSTRVPRGYWLGDQNFGSGGAFAPNLNELRLEALPYGGIIVDALSVSIVGASGAGGIVRCGIYIDTDGDNVPDTLLVEASQTADATVAASQPTLLLPQPVAIPSRGCWLAAVAQVAVGTVTFKTGDLPAGIGLSTVPPLPNSGTEMWFLVGVAGALPKVINPAFSFNPIHLAARRA